MIDCMKNIRLKSLENMLFAFNEKHLCTGMWQRRNTLSMRETPSLICSDVT